MTPISFETGTFDLTLLAVSSDGINLLLHDELSQRSIPATVWPTDWGTYPEWALSYFVGKRLRIAGVAKYEDGCLVHIFINSLAPVESIALAEEFDQLVGKERWDWEGHVRGVVTRVIG
jgi:hypothetical protein